MRISLGVDLLFDPDLKVFLVRRAGATAPAAPLQAEGRKRELQAGPGGFYRARNVKELWDVLQALAVNDQAGG